MWLRASSWLPGRYPVPSVHSTMCDGAHGECHQAGIQHLQPIQQCVAEFMVSAIRQDLVSSTLRVSTEFMMATVRGSGLPRGMPLVTRVLASSEQLWEPMASSSLEWISVKKRAPYHCLDG
jgi:hypothetical protein